MINQHPGGERPAAGLVMEQIGKRFASVTALNAVTLRLNPGEIHGLIGENGAGKSTLIKILAGVYQADSGSATLDGHPLPLGNPAAIEAAGIRVIHQELNLIPHFTVAESVFLGQEYRTRWGALDRRRMKAATAQFFQQNWQLALDPERLVRDLSLAERKLVQIARALIDGAARLVVFDEPTAPLEAQEASLVSSAILRLRDQGIAILYISHYLNEIATFGWERRGVAEQKARDWIEQLAIRPGRPGLPVRYMSGGNQQKAILARWLGTDARLFILDEPTLGVDIGARRDIYQRTRQLADQGRAVLVSSSDAPELLGLCDRILVLWRGALAANLPTRGLTLDALLVAINGGQEPSP